MGHWLIWVAIYLGQILKNKNKSSKTTRTASLIWATMPLIQESDCTPSSSYSVTNTCIFGQCSDSAWFCKIWDPCPHATERSDTNRTRPHQSKPPSTSHHQLMNITGEPKLTIASVKQQQEDLWKERACHKGQPGTPRKRKHEKKDPYIEETLDQWFRIVTG